MKKIGWSKNTVVFCDGSVNEKAQHPRVWLNMKNAGKVICPYCGQEYRLKENSTQ